MFSRWPWPHSEATKKCPREDKLSSQAIVLAVLLGGVALVFWQQLVGAAVFIGESDRLNAYLNMRLAEYDALQTYGRVPAWNPTMFGGFSIAALHWMNPGTDPIAFFLQLFPRGRVYQALGYVSIALVLAACTSAYFYIRDLTGARIPAAIAALCYGLSVFGIHRIAQIDNIYLVLLLLPAAMLAIRRVRTENLIRPFVGLALSMTALAFLGIPARSRLCLLLSRGLRTLSRRGALEIRTESSARGIDRFRDKLGRRAFVCCPPNHCP
jgi:hypothetical protein